MHIPQEALDKTRNLFFVWCQHTIAASERLINAEGVLADSSFAGEMDPDKG